MIFKRSPITAEVRANLGIESSERVIAWGVGDSAHPEVSYVIATSAALYDQRTGARYPWVDVVKGTWQQPDFHLTVSTPSGALRPVIRMDDPREVPAAVRDRVTDTVVISEYIDLGDEAGAQFVARRDPDGDIDNIRWSVVFDSGLDPADPHLRAKADAALDRLRSSLGI